MTISDMGAAELLVALVAAMIGFALVSVLADLWRNRQSDASRADKRPKDGRN
jgi:hypothetical protein